MEIVIESIVGTTIYLCVLVKYAANIVAEKKVRIPNKNLVSVFYLLYKILVVFITIEFLNFQHQYVYEQISRDWVEIIDEGEKKILCKRSEKGYFLNRVYSCNLPNCLTLYEKTYFELKKTYCDFFFFFYSLYNCDYRFICFIASIHSNGIKLL